MNLEDMVFVNIEDKILPKIYAFVSIKVTVKYSKLV